MSAIVLGLAGGWATLGISEVLIRWWGDRPIETFWKVVLVGIALRAVWILGLLIIGLQWSYLEPAGFSAALLAAYFTAQVFEGFRYQQFIRTR